MARAAFDLAIVSVLLDAGAGRHWRYEEGRTGEIFSAPRAWPWRASTCSSAAPFRAGPEDPFRVDADVLMALTAEDLAEGFQVAPDNPLVGLEGRAALLNRLGRVVATNPDIFGQHDDPRPGGLFDVIAAAAEDGSIRATAILEALLDPSRPDLAGPHHPRRHRSRRHLAPPARRGARRHGRARALPQAVAMALLFADRAARMGGHRGRPIDGLTGLPEYRNGGLFLDTGVLALQGPGRCGEAACCRRSSLVVEWRALTVALLDRIARRSRAALGLPRRIFPSPRCSKAAPGRRAGGWRGRSAATARRLSSSISDGTVF